MEEKRQIVSSLKESLLEETIDMGSEFLEIPIDQLIDNDMLRDIPIVNTLVGLGKIAMNVRDLYLIKKTVAFIASLNQNKLSKEKIARHKAKLETDSKKLNKELEFIMVMLDRMNETQKSIIMSNMYLKYLDEKTDFDWEDFGILTDILERFSIYDCPTLLEVYDKGFIGIEDEFNKLGFSRLNSLGLIDYFGGMRMSLQSGENFIARINPLGQFFVENGLTDLNGSLLKFV